MQLRFDADEAPRTLQTPILVSLFRAAAVVVLLGTAVATVVALKTGESLVNIPIAALVAAGGALASLVPFCVAQVILLVAKIEYNTAAQTDAALLQSLHNIEGHLKSARAAEVNDNILPLDHSSCHVPT